MHATGAVGEDETAAGYSSSAATSKLPLAAALTLPSAFSAKIFRVSHWVARHAMERSEIMDLTKKCSLSLKRPKGDHNQESH